MLHQRVNVKRLEDQIVYVFKIKLAYWTIKCNHKIFIYFLKNLTGRNKRRYQIFCRNSQKGRYSFAQFNKPLPESKTRTVCVVMLIK